MGRRHHGYVVLGDVDAYAQAVLVDVGEVVLGLLGVFVGHVEIHVVVAALLHLAVDGAGHHIARCKRQARIILLHKFLAAQVAQHGAVSAHGLGDEECGTVAGMIEGCGVKLHELHVFHRALGAIDHGYAVASGDERIGGGAVHRAYAAGGHKGDARQEGVDLACGLVEHIGAIALNVAGAAGHYLAQMVLGDYLDGKVVFIHVDVGVILNRLHQRLLNFVAGVVGMVQNAELRVPALAVQVVGAVGLLVKLNAPLHQLLDLAWSLCHHLAHGSGVAEPVASHHGVVYVLVEVVDEHVGHRSHTALRQVGVGLIERCFANQRHCSGLRHLECETHAGHARANYQIVIFAYHLIYCYLLYVL